MNGESFEEMSVLFRSLILHSATLQRWRVQFRTRRMWKMLRLISPPRHARVVDLGGTWELWNLIPHEFTITLVNRSPWPSVPDCLAERCRIVVADACDLGGLFDSGSFDLAFSNSVIEHVGGKSRRMLFAEEVRRLAPSWWIQTPHPGFPIEAHTGLPYYWQWPDWAKARAESIRQRQMPDWHEEMASTEPLHEEEMRSLFPGGWTYRECTLGMVKSVALYRPFTG